MLLRQVAMVCGISPEMSCRLSTGLMQQQQCYLAQSTQYPSSTFCHTFIYFYFIPYSHNHIPHPPPPPPPPPDCLFHSFIIRYEKTLFVCSSTHDEPIACRRNMVHTFLVLSIRDITSNIRLLVSNLRLCFFTHGL